MTENISIENKYMKKNASSKTIIPHNFDSKAILRKSEISSPNCPFETDYFRNGAIIEFGLLERAVWISKRVLQKEAFSNHSSFEFVLFLLNIYVLSSFSPFLGVHTDNLSEGQERTGRDARLRLQPGPSC